MRFRDKVISCARCSRKIGTQKLDGQLLVLDSGLAIYNFVRLRCVCSKVINWESPNLTDDLLPDKLQDLPTVGTIINLLVGVETVD